MTKAKFDLSQGIPIAIERQTVSQFLERWLEDSVRPSVRQLTYQQYEQHVRLYLSPALGMTAITKLAPQQVQAFVNANLRAGLSPRTVQLSIVILRRALDQAVKWGLAVRNVAKLIDAPKVPRHEIKPLSADDARKLMEAANGRRWETIYTVALALGLREGEALGLKWSDIDLEGRTLNVKRTLARIGGKRYGAKGKLVLSEPKTARSRRSVALPDFVVKALKVHRSQQAAARLGAGSAWKDSGLVFATGKGTPIEPSSLVADFKALLVKANLPRETRFHDLRHSAASLWLAKGVPLKVIQELLGHSSITLTADTYSHVLDDLKRDAADRMDVALGGKQ
jgi:integrase